MAWPLFGNPPLVLHPNGGAYRPPGPSKRQQSRREGVRQILTDVGKGKPAYGRQEKGEVKCNIVYTCHRCSVRYPPHRSRLVSPYDMARIPLLHSGVLAGSRACQGGVEGTGGGGRRRESKTSGGVDILLHERRIPADVCICLVSFSLSPGRWQYPVFFLLPFFAMKISRYTLNIHHYGTNSSPSGRQHPTHCRRGAGKGGAGKTAREEAKGNEEKRKIQIKQ